MCVLVRHTFRESLVNMYATKHKYSMCVTDRQKLTKLQKYQTEISYFVFIYGQFCTRTFLSGSRKNSGNKGLKKNLSVLVNLSKFTNIFLCTLVYPISLHNREAFVILFRKK